MFNYLSCLWTFLNSIFLNNYLLHVIKHIKGYLLMYSMFKDFGSSMVSRGWLCSSCFGLVNCMLQPPILNSHFSVKNQCFKSIQLTLALVWMV